MRRLFLIALLLLVAAVPAISQQVTLVWDANSDSDLAGYKVYYGTTSRTYNAPVDVGNVTTYTVTGLDPGTYFFAVTAYNTSALESGYSNEVSTAIPVNVVLVGPPGPPGPKGDPGTPAPVVTSPFVLIVVPAISTYSATVAWVTVQECSGTVLWGLAANQLTNIIVANNLGVTDHLAVINGLSSRVHYFFQVTGVCNGATIQSDIRSFNSK